MPYLLEQDSAGTSSAGAGEQPDRSPARPRRVLYLDGPGNVLQTFRAWLAESEDHTEVSRTFSGDFFDAIEEQGAHAYVLATHRVAGSLRSGRFTVEHRPVASRSRDGLRYHLGEVCHAIALTVRALRWGADVVVVADQLHWFALWPLKLFRRKVVVMLHCAFWPAGHRPSTAAANVLERLNGFFWRHGVDATLCVSPEVERQLLTVAGSLAGPIVPVRAQYHRAFFDAIPGPVLVREGPFRVLFAGRLEGEKGIFDLLEVACRLEAEQPGAFTFELCGDGSARNDLAECIAAKQAGAYFFLAGKLGREEMAAAYGRSHAVVVPTGVGFAEGMNRVAIEGVLAGRPVVTTPLSHAEDLLGHALVSVPAGNLDAYMGAFKKLRDDPAFYREVCAGTRHGTEPFFDRRFGYKAALQQTLETLFPDRSSTPPFPGFEDSLEPQL